VKPTPRIRSLTFDPVKRTPTLRKRASTRRTPASRDAPRIPRIGNRTPTHPTRHRGVSWPYSMSTTCIGGESTGQQCSRRTRHRVPAT
jgi:hypothetical protein